MRIRSLMSLGSIRSSPRGTRSYRRAAPVSLPQCHLRASSKDVSSAALESAALSYLAAHYIDGVAAIFASQPPNHFTVQIVSNKYNPANFWFVVFALLDVFRSVGSFIEDRAGRWRSQYEIDFGESETIVGKVLVNVHYYEQGNVGTVSIVLRARPSSFIHRSSWKHPTTFRCPYHLPLRMHPPMQRRARYSRLSRQRKRDYKHHSTMHTTR